LTTVVQEVADGNEHQPERGENQNEGGGGVRVVRPYLDGRVVQARFRANSSLDALISTSTWSGEPI
jgi:hypothetical protein